MLGETKGRLVFMEYLRASPIKESMISDLTGFVTRGG